MRVYVSVDMEGVAGVSHAAPTAREDNGYAAAVDLMVGEANASIEGAFDAGATEVVVNDSHGSMFNLVPERMDRRARLVQGTKPFSMVEAAHDGHFDVALFVGYHARAGHPRGTIAHTYSAKPTLTSIGGRPVGEYGINGLFLGGLGVPVGLVTGDDALAEEVESWLPWAERVVVKRAVSRQAADSLHPHEARRLIRDGSRRAVARAVARDGLQPLRVQPPIVVELEFANAGEADYAAVIPGFSRVGDRGVRYEAGDAFEAYRAFVSAVRMARLGDE